MFNQLYNEVTLLKVEAFKRATYVMVSANPEDDVNHWMEEWGQKSGLLQLNPNAYLIGWDYPFLSDKQKEDGLRGYAAAYMMPNDFEVNSSGIQIDFQKETQYAVLSIENPFIQPFDTIPQTYQKILTTLNEQGIQHVYDKNYLSCFEYLFEKDGNMVMNIFVHVGV